MHPTIPPVLQEAIFSLMNKDFKTEYDKKVNNFLLDVYNECKNFFESNHEIK